MVKNTLTDMERESKVTCLQDRYTVVNTLLNQIPHYTAMSSFLLPW